MNKLKALRQAQKIEIPTHIASPYIITGFKTCICSNKTCIEYYCSGKWWLLYDPYQDTYTVMVCGRG